MQSKTPTTEDIMRQSQSSKEQNTTLGKKKMKLEKPAPKQNNNPRYNNSAMFSIVRKSSAKAKQESPLDQVENPKNVRRFLLGIFNYRTTFLALTATKPISHEHSHTAA